MVFCLGRVSVCVCVNHNSVHLFILLSIHMYPKNDLAERLRDEKNKLVEHPLN